MTARFPLDDLAEFSSHLAEFSSYIAVSYKCSSSHVAELSSQPVESSSHLALLHLISIILKNNISMR
jgi:hypothetical protein